MSTLAHLFFTIKAIRATPTYERLSSLLRSQPGDIRMPLLMLMMSGLGGIFKWPPKDMQVYETLIKVTGISGPGGGLVRISVATFVIIGYLLPYKNFRRATYMSALLSCLLISIATWDTSQGFASGVWAGGAIMSWRAIYAEGAADAYNSNDVIFDKVVANARNRDIATT